MTHKYSKLDKQYSFLRVEYDNIKRGLCCIHDIPTHEYDTLKIGYYTHLKSGKLSPRSIRRGMCVKFPDGSSTLLDWGYIKDVVIPECRHWFTREKRRLYVHMGDRDTKISKVPPPLNVQNTSTTSI